MFVTQNTRVTVRGRELPNFASFENPAANRALVRKSKSPPCRKRRDKGGAPRIFARSHLQVVQVGNAVLHHVELHLDEVVLDAARLGSGENLLPVEGVLPYWHYLPCLR